MKRVLRLAVPIVMLSFLGMSAGVAAQDAQTASGEVKAMASDSVTINAGDGEDQVFAIDSDTSITERGYQLTATELGYGDIVSVTYEDREGTMHATLIDVTTRYRDRYL